MYDNDAIRQRRPATGPMLACALLVLISRASPAAASDIEGFTEPYRVINVAAAEVGIITELEIREGDIVSQEQVLARLNDSVPRASLRIAEASMNAKGQLNSVVAEAELKQDRLAKLVELLQSNSASQEEIDRANMEVQVADARVLAAREALDVKKLEFERIKVQLEQRVMRSTINGVVTEIYKDIGEHVSPTDPVVIKVVQLDPLYATFSMTSHDVTSLKQEQPVEVMLGRSGGSARGVVEFISPVTNAESGTVRVKVRLPNPKQQYRSGERCTLVLPTRKNVPRLSRSQPSR